MYGISFLSQFAPLAFIPIAGTNRQFSLQRNNPRGSSSSGRLSPQQYSRFHLQRQHWTQTGNIPISV